jgi:hypothetical protein
LRESILFEGALFFCICIDFDVAVRGGEQTDQPKSGERSDCKSIAALLRFEIACYFAPSRLALDAHCSPKKTQFITFRGINLHNQKKLDTIYQVC